MMHGALAVAALFALHSRSEGRSSFVIDEVGRVAVEIKLGSVDLPELCNVDLSVREREAEELEKLALCLEGSLKTLLRIKGDEQPCPVVYVSHDVNSGTVIVRAAAQCAAFPQQLSIDWGLFAGGALDHVSIATVEQPYADAKLAMLSRRASRLVVEVARPLWPKVLAGSAVMLAAGGIAAVIVVRRFNAKARSRG